MRISWAISEDRSSFVTNIYLATVEIRLSELCKLLDGTMDQEKSMNIAAVL